MDSWRASPEVGRTTALAFASQRGYYSSSSRCRQSRTRLVERATQRPKRSR